MTPSPRWSEAAAEDLIELREAIRLGLPNVEFAMSNSGGRCCFAGHAQKLWGGPFGHFQHLDHHRLTRGLRDGRPDGRLASILGPEDFDRLVYPPGEEAWNIGREDAVRVLDELITTGRVNWGVIWGRGSP